MTDAETQITRAITDLNAMANAFYEQMKVYDRKIAELAEKREEISLQYNQCIARLRDLEKDLDWVQGE